jgi:hypothetical protein
MEKIKLMLGMFFSAILALALVSAHMGDYDNYYSGMGSMMYGSYGYGGMIFAWLTGVLFIAVLVLLIIWLIKQIEKR